MSDAGPPSGADERGDVADGVIRAGGPDIEARADDATSEGVAGDAGGDTSEADAAGDDGSSE
jgi:hypothetical protein